jgi:hypothetical protein
MTQPQRGQLNVSWMRPPSSDVQANIVTPQSGQHLFAAGG